MKNNVLTLKTMYISNFKGLKAFVLDAVNNTYVYGKNGTGKTTLADAYRWLLTGKNSNDQNIFEIKPVDQNGNRAQKTENEVFATFDYNGKEISLKRVHREKWVTKKGAEKPVFTGNETAYFWNDVPLKESEYKAKVSEMISEDRLKLLTDTVYFNSLKWQERRAILSEIAGEVTNEEVLEQMAALFTKDELAILNNVLQSGKTFAERKKELASKKKIAKDELKLIPSRIDEVNRGLPDLSNLPDVAKLADDLKDKIATLDSQISNTNKAYEAQENQISEKRREIFKLKQSLAGIEDQIRIDIEKDTNVNGPKKAELNSQIKKLQQEQNSLQARIETQTRLKTNGVRRIPELEKLVISREEKLANLKAAWSTENEKLLVFRGDEFNCPCCLRPLESGDIESKKSEMIQNFADKKKNQLEIIVADATAEKNQLNREIEEIEELKESVKQLNIDISNLGAELSAIIDALTVLEDELAVIDKAEKDNAPVDTEALVVDRLARTSGVQEIFKKIETLESEVAEFKPLDQTETIEKKQVLQAELNKQNEILNQKKQVDAGKKRIQELQDQEASLSQTIAEYEREEYIIQQFISKQISLTESKVNTLFSFVQFRMFDQTIDGNEYEVCDTMINGVPYNDANTASKINAGLDIINVLSNYYGFVAPVWIDNRESVTEIIPTSAQVISLIVSPDHQELSIK